MSDFLEKFLVRVDKIIDMYVNPNKPYDSPKIVDTSLKTIKEVFSYEMNYLHNIIINIEKMTRDPKSIVSDSFVVVKNQFEQEFSNLGINASNLVVNINDKLDDFTNNILNGEIFNKIENSYVVQSLLSDMQSVIQNLNLSITNISQFLINEYSATNFKNEFHGEISNINNLSKNLNSNISILLTSATVFFGVSSFCVLTCTGIYCYKSYKEYKLNKKKFEVRNIDRVLNPLLNK